MTESTEAIDLTEANTVEAYLKTVAGAWPDRTIEQYVLESGKIPSLEPFTADEEAFLLVVFRRARPPFRTRACFENAARLVWAADGLNSLIDMGCVDGPLVDVAYGEGFANRGILPTLHGVLLLNGKPVDLTYRDDMFSGDRSRSPARLLDRAKWCLANVEYYLVELSRDRMDELLLAKGTYGLIDDWAHDWPLLREWKAERERNQAATA